MSWKETLTVRAWALRNVFLLFFVKPRVLEISDDRCEIVIPLTWRTRRHDIHAMYLGVLCMGADVASGLIAFDQMQKRKLNLSFLFKDLKAEFLKRAEGDVHFTNEDGAVVEELIARTLETGERQHATVHVTATVPKKLGDEPVAKFEMTLSLKKKGD
jgi:acyl-coenzyme A thioesterase PaaI-like protein